MKRIAVDAMGGDHAPQAVVEGVNQALATFPDIEIQLYGDEAKIKNYLTAKERVSIVHTTEKINSDDEPVKAIRRNQGCQGWPSRCGLVSWKYRCSFGGRRLCGRSHQAH